MKPSKQQNDICAESRVGERNLVVEARAGTGKSTTIGMIAASTVDVSNRLGVTFGKEAASSLNEKTSVHGMESRTYHSAALSATSTYLQNKKQNFTVNFYKEDEEVRKFLPEKLRFVSRSVTQLMSFCKNGLVSNPSPEYLHELALEYDIDLFDADSPEVRYTIVEIVQKLLPQSIEDLSVISADDMMSAWYFHDIPLPEYDLICADEFQDTNYAQAEFVCGSVSPGGKIIGVGDTYQSIYAWRGATSNAMYALKERLDALVLPLNVTYRCPLSVVQLVNQEFPEIDFVPADGAAVGSVQTVSPYKVNYVPGDMVLCRVNAPLVRPALQLLKQRVRAVIKGKEIGQSIVSLIKKLKCDTVYEMLMKLGDYRDAELEKLTRLNKPYLIHRLDDKVEVIHALCEGQSNVWDVIRDATALFSDDKTPAITFSSVHKAKGLEARNVYILRPDLMPHPRAKSPEEVQGERNVRYVAITRALENLTFVEKGEKRDEGYN